jgi:hypothetical protein
MHSDISMESITLVPREPRFAVDVEVDVMRLSDERVVRGRLRDVHERGLCVEHDLDVGPGDGVGVEISTHPATGGRVSIFAEVCWTDAGRTGLRVGGMLPHHRERLKRLLASASGRPQIH